MQQDATTHTKERMLTFRGGGWVILLAALLTIAIAIWALLPAMTRGPAPAAATTPDDYGFDLTNLRVPKSELIAALPYKDSLPKWDHPLLVPADVISEQIRFDRKKYLVSTDRVIGVTIAGESRAYPISVLTVHEIINDTLAGVPIAITYHLWCDSAVVFERSVGGEPVEFASSGMLINSNMIMFDRRDNVADESLFRQLDGEALAGKAAARDETLRILPVTVTIWKDWLAMHPDTSVIGWDARLVKRYEGSSPDQYFRSPELPFPVDPLPPAGSLEQKDRIVAVTIDGERRVYPIKYIAEHVDEDGRMEDMIGTTPIVFRYDRDYHAAALEMPGGDDVQVIYAMWFAWFAVHGDADVVGLGDSRTAADDGGTS